MIITEAGNLLHVIAFILIAVWAIWFTVFDSKGKILILRAHALVVIIIKVVQKKKIVKIFTLRSFKFHEELMRISISDKATFISSGLLYFIIA